MGRLDSEPFLLHFSHKHSLKLLNFQTQTGTNLTCAGCKLQARGSMYVCIGCNFYLHRACAHMPRNKTHHSHPNHSLVLQPLPVYSQGAFKCNACGEHGKGFCYNCEYCKIDLHTLCAHMPSSVDVNTHAHTLNLLFNAPYRKNGFQCDICHCSGSNTWLYTCRSCNYDAHLNCALANLLSTEFSNTQQYQTGQQQEQHQLFRPVSFPQQHTGTSSLVLTANANNQNPEMGYSVQRSIPANSPGSYQANATPFYLIPQSVLQQPSRTNNLASDLARHVLRGAVDGVAEQAGQILLQSILGGLLS